MGDMDQHRGDAPKSQPDASPSEAGKRLMAYAMLGASVRPMPPDLVASGGEIPGPIDREGKNAYVFFQHFEDMYAECTCGHYKDTEHADGVCEVQGCGCQR